MSLAALPGKLRVLELGEGKPLLFIHGGGSLASCFVTLLPYFAGYRCILFDRPGHGLSEAFEYRDVDLRRHAVEVLEGVLDALGLEHSPLVGNSHGGLWAFRLTLDRPERVQGVVQRDYACAKRGVIQLDRPERVQGVVQLGCPGHLLETVFQSLWARLFMQPAFQRFVLGLKARRISRAPAPKLEAWTRR